MAQVPHSQVVTYLFWEPYQRKTKKEPQSTYCHIFRYAIRDSLNKSRKL